MYIPIRHARCMKAIVYKRLMQQTVGCRAGDNWAVTEEVHECKCSMRKFQLCKWEAGWKQSTKATDVPTIAQSPDYGYRLHISAASNAASSMHSTSKPSWC
jgi:hypothetical protein